MLSRADLIYLFFSGYSYLVDGLGHQLGSKNKSWKNGNRTWYCTLRHGQVCRGCVIQKGNKFSIVHDHACEPRQSILYYIYLYLFYYLVF